MTYLELVAGNRRLLAFGFLVAFCSSFGQTFFISLFSAPLRAEFGLSDGGFGLLYSIATLASGLSLIWLGRKIDHWISASTASSSASPWSRPACSWRAPLRPRSSAWRSSPFA